MRKYKCATVRFQSRHRRRKLLLACASALALFSLRANADPLNPLAFTSLGALSLNSGSITINTDTMQITGAANFTGVSYAQSGGSNIAVFCFNNINLESNVNVTVTGSQPLALLSIQNATIDNVISVDAGAAQQSPGPGASMSALGGTGGGGFGGNGGNADVASDGGRAYADLAQVLQSGSSAGSAFSTGGQGGGAIEIGATNNLTIDGTVSANGGDGQMSLGTSSGGGSGGGVILSAGNALSVSHATLTANGGNSPDAQFSVGGGGGGGAILLDGVQTTFNPSNPSQSLTSVVGTVTGGSGGTDELAPDTIGTAGVITLVPRQTIINTAQSYSGLLIAQAGSMSQNTPTVQVQLGNVSIASIGTLTQGCDQLIVPGSTMTDTGTYALAGYTQTLGNLTGSGTVNLSNGSRLTINVPSGTDSFNGKLIETSTSPGGGGSLIKNGAGTLALSGTSSYTGSTTVNAGELLFSANSAVPINTGLDIAPGASVVFANRTTGAAIPLQLTDLANSGVLNLNNNDAIIHNSNLGLLTFEVKQGYNGGHWNGSFGILSSTAAFTLGSTLGIESAGSYGQAGFDGVTVASNDVLIKFTWLGDANLDGVINAADLSAISSSGTTWATGDFNYDGVVNADDYALFMLGAAFGNVNISTTVPEPANRLLIASLSVAGVCPRRRLRR
jgi:fibronectin-binding autotransporter adhesin